MSKLSKINTLFNTVKYLKPIQIINQLKCRLPNKDSFDRYPSRQAKNNAKLFIPELDYSVEYLKRFDVDEMLRGKITILYNEFKLFSWYDEKATHLQNFNLHYFEYLIPLAYKYLETEDIRCYNLIKQLLDNWTLQNSSADAKHPYTTSLRILNLLIVGSILNDQNIINSVYPQYRYLINHQEKNLLGNHYFENLKSIVICSVIFDEEDVYRKFIKKLLDEINVQLLDDGVHCELSPMYHKIVLEGIIRIAYVLKQAGRKEMSLLIPAIQKMVTAMYSLEKGIGRTPLFNDSGDNVAKDAASILNAAKELFGIVPEDKLEFCTSGYYKLYDGSISMIVDAGEIGPSYIPGHGQCDCLSFELSVNEKPVFVNSGTYQYQGELRPYFRSTRAHNTVVIGETEQSEVWGEHRVARRIKNVHAVKIGNIIEASYTNYLNEKHSRKFVLNNYVLEIVDSVYAKVSASIRSFLHIAEGYDILINNESILILEVGNPICTIQAINAKIVIHENDDFAMYSPEFGKILKTKCLEFIWEKNSKEQRIIIDFKNEGEQEY